MARRRSSLSKSSSKTKEVYRSKNISFFSSENVNTNPIFIFFFFQFSSKSKVRMESSRRDSDNNGDDETEESSYNADTLLKQNYELRHRLEEEAASYKRRLDTYRQAQQHQAALVSRLQAKV